MPVVEPTKEYARRPYGWLSPGGKFYSCARAAHLYLAGDIVQELMPRTAERLRDEWRTPDEYLLRQGWIKVGGWGYSDYFAKRKSPTQKQLDVVWDICQAINVTMPDFDRADTD